MSDTVKLDQEIDQERLRRDMEIMRQEIIERVSREEQAKLEEQIRKDKRYEFLKNLSKDVSKIAVGALMLAAVWKVTDKDYEAVIKCGDNEFSLKPSVKK